MASVKRCWLRIFFKIQAVGECGSQSLGYSYLIILILLFSPPLSAVENSEEDELNQLMEILNQQTTLATQTQLNADYVPGMVSIMTGEEMRQRGFDTLWDALAYLPGIQLNIDATGKRTLIVRGLGKTTETSKIKIQLNSISLNQSTTASSVTLFDMPVSQIEKIEFIRGPGSAIHGENALLGVLNVITAKQGKGISVGLDSNNKNKLMALYEFGQLDGVFSGSVNLAVSDSKGEDIEVTNDKTATTITGYAPGSINNKKDSVSAILDMSIYGIDLNLQYQQSNRGDYFGINNYLPPPEKQTVISDTVTTIQLAKDFKLAEDLAGAISVTELINETEKNAQFLGVAPVYGGFNNQDDIVSDIDQRERRTTWALNLNYHLDGHSIYSELSVTRISVEKFSQYINLDPVTKLPVASLNEFPAPVAEGEKRKIKSLVLQDEYAINENTTLTAGLRYDDFDNEYNNLAPRAAIVWILSKQHILKFQYAEAFRPPNLRESGGSIDGKLTPEINRTSEFSYIYNSYDTLIKNTIYFSEINDYIRFIDTAPMGYSNTTGAELSGLEIEVKKNLSPRLVLGSNLTLQNSKDLTTGEKLYGSTPLLATLNIDYQINSSAGIDFQVKYISDQVREIKDSRSDLESITVADITLTKDNVFNMDDLTLRAGIRNIFAQKTRYLAPNNTYTDDYLINNDASLWLELVFYAQ
jgi:outer membrane receptor for ferrienterochelin and colicins